MICSFQTKRHSVENAIDILETSTVPIPESVSGIAQLFYELLLLQYKEEDFTVLALPLMGAIKLTVRNEAEAQVSQILMLLKRQRSFVVERIVTANNTVAYYLQNEEWPWKNPKTHTAVSG